MHYIKKFFLTKNKNFVIIIIENEREIELMNELILLIYACVIFGTWSIVVIIYDYLENVKKGRKALDEKCAARKRAIEELLEIRRNRIE